MALFFFECGISCIFFVAVELTTVEAEAMANKHQCLHFKAKGQEGGFKAKAYTVLHAAQTFQSDIICT